MSSKQPQVEVFISLGGNIGDPSVTIVDALTNLSKQQGVVVTTCSPFYKTPPWGKTDQAEFINACARLTTTLTPQALLETCLAVETSMGRVREERWGPRIIDIDILTYGDQTIADDNLSIPHPLIAQRAFVLVPLLDIAPDFSLHGKSIDTMLQTLDRSGIKRLDLMPDQHQAS